MSEESSDIIEIFKKFMGIQRIAQTRFQAFIQTFDEEMYNFFQNHLLPLTEKKSSKTIKFQPLDHKKPEFSLPIKRQKESPPCIPIAKKAKNSDQQLCAHMDQIKSKVRDLYSKNVNPLLIAKLFNLSPDRVHGIGNWKQAPEEIQIKMSEMKAECEKLQSQGLSIKDISKKMKCPKKRVMNLLGELSPYDLLKSAESKQIIVNKISEGASKQNLANELGMPFYRLQHWINDASEGKELSDEDAIQSEGEIPRDTIRNSLYYYYKTNSKDMAANTCNIDPDYIDKWAKKLENSIDEGKIILPPSSELYERNNNLVAEYLKNSNGFLPIQDLSFQRREDKEIDDDEENSDYKMQEQEVALYF
ncbi:unnamed protein product [Blepharisma stoltei]|uniref:HNH homing endonuclease n=1 Tax=Blepharisma stoltei TaxID=1481888 RepID=A0AAU9JXP3_9CILI|nr:unnamed protein product [Blepharisma stoltei]